MCFNYSAWASNAVDAEGGCGVDPSCICNKAGNAWFASNGERTNKRTNGRTNGRISKDATLIDYIELWSRKSRIFRLILILLED